MIFLKAITEFRLMTRELKFYWLAAAFFGLVLATVEILVWRMS